MRVAIGMAFLLAASAAAAQTNKCVDKAGKVTYSSESCASLKLKDAGEVEDRITVAPAEKPAAKSSAKPKATKPAATAPAKPTPQAATTETTKPERRCFQVRSVSGTSGVRCNDDPGVPNPVPTDERTKGEVKAQ